MSVEGSEEGVRLEDGVIPYFISREEALLAAVGWYEDVFWFRGEYHDASALAARRVVKVASHRHEVLTRAELQEKMRIMLAREIYWAPPSLYGDETAGVFLLIVFLMLSMEQLIM